MDETTPKLFYYLGGRKMTLTILAIAVGTAVDLLTVRGLSATFATFLAGAVASFSAANAITTVKTAGMTSSVEVVADPRVDQLANELAQSKLETKQELEAGVNAIQGLANTIENMKKLLTAVATGKKVS